MNIWRWLRGRFKRSNKDNKGEIRLEVPHVPMYSSRLPRIPGSREDHLNSKTWCLIDNRRASRRHTSTYRDGIRRVHPKSDWFTIFLVHHRWNLCFGRWWSRGAIAAHPTMQMIYIYENNSYDAAWRWKRRAEKGIRHVEGEDSCWNHRQACF